jgi:FixJ family two-component response regulator
MPGRSGAELVGELARTHPGLPVVIMSGYSEETASRNWRVPENASFLEKPVSPRALVEVVDRLLSGKSD